MKKLLYIGGIVIVIVAGFLILKPEPPFGATDDTAISKLQTKYNNAPKAIKDKYVLADNVLTKKDIKNAELDKYKGEPKDEIEITIGNKPDQNLMGATDTNFTPSIELKRWNEVSFKIIPDISKVATKDRTLKFDGDKILFETPKMNFEMYDVAEGEGSYKFIWYLNERPATNKIEFEITTQGLDFFYQPPLNLENTDPSLTCTETQCKDANGNVVMERPENVVGSYAVYHSTKGGMNDAYGKDYKVGKAFHIYRPHLIDANGLEAWGNLHIENGIYSVEIPQDFLDKAVYPIKSNDTFGYSTGGSSVLGGIGYSSAIGTLLNGVASGNGSVDSITAYVECQYGTRYVKGVMINSSKEILADGVSPASTAIPEYDSTPPITSTKTVTYSTKPSVTNGSTYYLFIIQSSGTSYVAMDTGSGDNSFLDFSNNYTTPTNPTDASANTNKYSIYATYTPSGGGAVVSPINNTLIIQNDF